MTVSRPLQIVVVGAGLIGPRHAEHVRNNLNTILSALIDPSPKAKTVASELQTSLFLSVGEYFKYIESYHLPKPDGAIICTPNHTHVMIAAQLSERGVNCLIEKPVGILPEEAKALKCFVENKDVQVLVGHHRRFNPYIVAARQNLDLVGEVIAIQGTWTLKKPLSYFTCSPWRTETKSGGGPILINLVHDIDLLQYLFGKVERVYAEPLKKQRKQYKNVDEGVCVVLRFENGITGTFICADNVTSSHNFESGTGENPLIPSADNVEGFYRVFGSKGTLSIPDLTLYHQQGLEDEKHGWNSPISRTCLIDEGTNVRNTLPFDSQLDHFVKIIRDKVKPLCTIDDGISALLCVNAILGSIESQLPVTVSTVDEITPDLDALGHISSKSRK